MRQEDAYVEMLLANYASTLEWIQEAMATIPEERFAECLPTAPNHPAWTLGHLACSAAFLGQLLDEPFGEAFPGEKPLVGSGSKPVTNGNYGGKEELLARLAERHALLTAAVRAKHSKYFPALPPERLRGIAPTIGHLALYLLASHEHYHLAQITMWSRAAGLTPA
jgi:hypothetical protein